jgi:hypothetical protein
MCNLYSITTNQAAIIALFRVINHYVGNLAQARRSRQPDCARTTAGERY